MKDSSKMENWGCLLMIGVLLLSIFVLIISGVNIVKEIQKL